MGAIIIGAIIVIVLAIIFGLVSFVYGPMLAVLIAGIVVDYLVDGDIRTGAMHGRIAGFTGEIIALNIRNYRSKDRWFSSFSNGCSFNNRMDN